MTVMVLRQGQAGGGGGLSWQLASGHYVPAQISPTVVHPRPDTETNSWERHRLAPDGIAWRIPITIQGGAWPFEYVVTSGPSGMSIGQHYGDANYGMLNWSNPVIGSYTITIRVRTQDYGRTTGSADSTGEYTITFNLSVVDHTDVTKFVYMDGVNGSDSNNGAFSTPIKTLAAFSGLSAAGKQFFIRNGTYALNVVSSPIFVGSNAKVWVGYPGESITIDYTGNWGSANCYIAFNGGQNLSGGCSASGISFFGSPANWATVNSSGNFDLYHINGSGDRQTYYECVFDSLNGHSIAPTNFSNWSGIAMFANASMHNYTCQVNNTYQNFSLLSSGGASVLYSTRYMVVEGCTVKGFSSPVNVQQGFISKGRCSYTTFRNLLSSDPTQGISTSPFYQNQGNDGGSGNAPDQNETCWCYGALTPPGNNGVLGSAHVYGAGSYTSWTGYIYRNTIIGANWMGAGSGLPSTLLLQNNILCTEHGISNDAVHYGTQGPLTLNDVGNVVDTFANRASVINSTTGQLLSTYANAHGITLGTVGWVPL